MNKIIIAILAGALALGGIYYALPFIVEKVIFNSQNISEVGVDFNRVKESLSDLQKTYGFHIECLEGGGSYSYYFDKGMDHLCVVRVDDASVVISRIKSTVQGVEKVSISGMNVSHIKWYYDCYGSTSYKKIHLDDYNYYVIDEIKNIVWYVQFST